MLSSRWKAFSWSSTVYLGFSRMCLALNMSPFFSRTSMMWKPSGVSTICEMVPGFRDMAASEKAGQKMLLEAIPSSPPLRALPGSSE